MRKRGKGAVGLPRHVEQAGGSGDHDVAIGCICGLDIIPGPARPRLSVTAVPAERGQWLGILLEAPMNIDDDTVSGAESHCVSGDVSFQKANEIGVPSDSCAEPKK
jgi:hypothetical protein